MKPEQRKAVEVIYEEIKTKHGDAAMYAVDTLAAAGAVYAHAADHCDDLAAEIMMLAHAATDRILAAAGKLALRAEVRTYATRILDTMVPDPVPGTETGNPPPGSIIH